MSTQKAKIAWSDVCTPKDEGGLGLRSLEEANKVSCLKLIWCILSARTALGGQWIHKYLIRKGSFWSVKDTSSLASQLTRVDIRNGSVTSFWNDHWSSLGKLLDLTGERGCIDLGIPINATVERAVQAYPCRKHRTSVLMQIEQEIMGLRRPGLVQEDDICLWKRENGDFHPVFSTSQTWHLTRSQSPKIPWHRGVWFPEATPKYSFITWFAMHNRLSTGDRILRWNPQAVSSCWLCNSAVETRDHLFFECSYSAEVWRGTTKDLAGPGCSNQWTLLIQKLATGLHGRTLSFLFRYSFQAVAYAIWFERNALRVAEPPKPPNLIILYLDKLVRNRISSLRRTVGSKHEKAMAIWFGRR